MDPPVRFSLDGIEALDAIDRCGSFAAAASDLGKTQSAVSYAIRTLEEALGISLFDRSGHRARLTAEGLAILDEGRFLLARARRIAWLSRRFSDGWEPRLRVVIDGVLPQEPIMAALKRLSDEGIPTHVEVRMEFLGGVQRRFERTDADLMAVKDFTPSPRLVAEALPPVDLVLVAAADHPCVTVATPHDTESLHRHLELAVHDSSDETEGTDTNAIPGARVFYLSDFHTKGLALRMGLGFGWMPADLVADDLAAGRLALVPFTPGNRRTVTPYLVHRADRPLGPAGLRLRELLLPG